MKRKAEHNLDRNNFLGDDDDDNAQQTSGPRTGENLATPEQLAQRRIVKLKLPSQILNQEGGQAQDRPAPKFELSGNLSGSNNSANQGQTANQAPSFLSKIVTSTTVEQQSSVTQPQEQKSNLFASILSKPAEGQPAGEQKSNLFANLSSSNAGPLFPSNNAASKPLFSGGGLFGSQNSGATSGSGAGAGTGLFANLFGNNSSSGLNNLANKDYSYVHKQTGENKEEQKQSGEPQKEAAKPAETKPTLFASLSEYKPPANLFSAGTSDTNKPPSLFASYSTGATPSFTSFLQNQGTGGSGIFSKSKDEDDGSGGEDDDGDEPQRTPSPEADITKSKGNYQYQFDYDKVVSKKVNKFKPGNKPMLVEGEISLNKNKNSNNHFIIYRNKAKLIQYQGQVYPQVSKIEYLNPRQEAISVVCFSTEKAEDSKAEGEAAKETPEGGKPKISRDVIKAMFATADDCNEFKKELEKVVQA